MTRSTLKVLLSSLAIAVSMPVFADRGDHDRHEHRHYRDHRHDHRHDHYRGGYRDAPCRIESWYDRDGYYRERRVCREARVSIPGPAVFLPPPPALFVQPPSVVIQPPGVFFR